MANENQDEKLGENRNRNQPGRKKRKKSTVSQGRRRRRSSKSSRRSYLRERSLIIIIIIIVGISLHSEFVSMNIATFVLSSYHVDETNANANANTNKHIKNNDDENEIQYYKKNKNIDNHYIHFDIHKRDLIAYATQGHAKAYAPLKERFQQALGTEQDGHYRFYFHSFDEDCNGCIFQHNTTLARGKNILIKTIASVPEYQRFKYVAIFDDDAFLYHRTLRAKPSPFLDRPKKVKKIILKEHIKAGNETENTQLAWKSLHEYLSSNQEIHPLVKPAFYNTDLHDKVDTYQSCTDENFWIIRIDYVHFYFPYMLVHEENFWLNAAVLFLIMERCYPTGMKVLHNWVVTNFEHRYEQSKEIYQNRKGMLHAQREYLAKRLPELGPWKLPIHSRDGMLNQRCNVQTDPPSSGLRPKCSKYTKVIFDKWIQGEYEP